MAVLRYTISSTNGAMKHIVLVLVAVAVALATASQNRFDNHRLFGVRLENPQQFAALQQIESDGTDGYLIWNEVAYGRDVDIMVAPHRLSEFVALASRMRMTYALKQTNVQR